ncbi:MAG: XRE family transcriptional regulator, partial [Sphaerochaeta sp.]|nr:XRE family transcriptional regulator [Sphaerochaeta sp.]
QIGLNKMAVSNYEMGKRTPDIATVRKLAEALNVPMARLLANDGENLAIAHGAFRKHACITKAMQEMILGNADRYLARLFSLVSVFGDAALAPIPVIEHVHATDYEAAGQYLREILGLPSSGPIGNITDILENKGYIICPIGIDDRHFSGNSGTVNGRPYIAVNTTMPAERQRFTLIHELAHLVFSFHDDQDEEHMVDGIAGAFLLPESDIKRELGPKRRDIRGDLRLIQKEYDVSMASIIMRAYQTGIITKSTYEITLKWMNAQGLRKNEKSGILPEESHLLEQLTLRAVAEEEITVSKAAELLEKPFTEVRELCYGGV